MVEENEHADRKTDEQMNGQKDEKDWSIMLFLFALMQICKKA